jgi:hypothetical protein
MSRETLLQSSFNAGVMSPQLLGRSDFDKYGSAVATLSNIIGIVAGPAVFRPGTQYITTAYSQDTDNRLIGFQFGTEQGYVLEFGDNQLRFFRNKGIILSDTEVTNGTFDTDLTGWTDASTGTGSVTQNAGVAELVGVDASNIGILQQELTYIGIEEYTITLDVAGTSVNYKLGTTAGASDIDSGTLTVGTGKEITFQHTEAGSVFLQFENQTSTTASIDNVVIDNPIYTIDTPYGAADLQKIRHTQDSDVLYLAFRSNTVPPQTLQRFGNAQWKLVEVSFQDGPYLDENKDTDKKLDYISGGTAAGSTGVIIRATGGHEPFASTDVGRLIRMKNTGTNVWGWMTITAVNSSTEVVVTLGNELTATSPTEFWRLGAFSQTTGYPAVVTFHEFRLVYANTNFNPNVVWLSESQGAGREVVLWAPSEVANTVTDSNSIYFPLVAGGVSAVRWMSSGNILAIGTSDNEWVIEPGDDSKAISPTNSRATRRTNHGALEDVDAVRIDGTVLYAKGTGTRVNRFVFNFSQDKYESTNITRLSNHLFANRAIREMVYAIEPYSLMWVRLDNGKLAALTFIDSEDVGGWSLHEIAGTGTGGETHAKILSIATIKSDDSNYSELWLTVQREIDGQETRYIEVLSEPFFLDDQKDATYVDSFLQYSGSAVSTLSGLDHLEGETVSVLGDGANESTHVVTGGQITISEPASTIVAGLPYRGTLETLDFDAANAFNGSSLGQIRRITEVQVRLFETGLLYYGQKNQSDDKLILLEPRSSDDLQDTAPALKAGLFELETLGSWDLQSGVKIQFRSPYPGTLTAIMFKAMVNEG